MLTTRTLTVLDAPALHRLYRASPGYFEIISMPIPLQVDVERELEAAAADPRRTVEFVLSGPEAEPVGCLDLKHDYPGPGDATINLLLIAQACQSRGLGSEVVRRLEERLRRGAPPVRRLLAGVYGHNPGARRFWERLGYRPAVDARPVLEWYAKALEPAAGLEENRLAAQG